MGRVALVLVLTGVALGGVLRALTLSAETEVRRIARASGIPIGAGELFPHYQGDRKSVV